MANRKEIADRAEAAVAAALEAEGFTVVNLNQLAGNCPFMDLLARRGTDRLLVQVKGTTTAAGKFGTPPHTARALHTVAAELDCYAIYGFAHLVMNGLVIRFATAAEVAMLAEEDEAAYLRRNRYHVNIDQFTVEASRIDELMDVRN